MKTLSKRTTLKWLPCIAVLALAGCGNKGPLVQADSPQAQEEGAPASTDARPAPSDTATPEATTPATTAPATETVEPAEPSAPVEPAVPPAEGNDDGDG